ncbi:peptidoglycan DD-metalloendopeptidase family protein [Streptomyces sp. JJ66]|uniref:peptidoglycan DD-metalloendopeptidase family protein n=1 Tax=Streptomyces sp. JJ66 TaxID=2803843 RepID=UPI0027E3A6CF|nr:peptidoglycan DD-metalloendopeptidase family protein [Streptomyces sp. JJ66]
MNDRPPSGPTATTGTGFSGYAGYEDPYGQAAAYGYGTAASAGYPAEDPLSAASTGDRAQQGQHAPYAGAGYGSGQEHHASAGDYTGAAYGGSADDGSAHPGDAAYHSTAYDSAAYGGVAYGGDPGHTPNASSPYGAAVPDLGGHPLSGDEAAGYATGGFVAESYGTGTHSAEHPGYEGAEGWGGTGWAADGWPTNDRPLAGIPAQPDYSWVSETTDAYPADGYPAEGYPAEPQPPSPFPADAPYTTSEHYAAVEQVAEGATESAPHHDEHAYDTGFPPAPEAREAGGDAATADAGPDTAHTGVGATAEAPAFCADADGWDASFPSPDELAPVEPAAAAVASVTATAGVPLGRAGRRRAAKPRRSALLTVAVPSVAVMGVAGIAAASVGGGVAESAEDTTAQAADEVATVKSAAVNTKLDTQLAGLTDDARDFGERASRTQERIDLKERQEAERKRKAEEAARKEAMRPKFALPVDQRGLSAYYGQAGINWMSMHTGIDFPVSYGTPVKAATDGTITTKWDVAYGNMAIVTAADGTQTWYCHLSSTKLRSGPVKAGDTLGYAGSSGNSTGPHLHFEVRPGGGAAVDPVAWFRTHGLDPT